MEKAKDRLDKWKDIKEPLLKNWEWLRKLYWCLLIYIHCSCYFGFSLPNFEPLKYWFVMFRSVLLYIDLRIIRLVILAFPHPIFEQLKHWIARPSMCSTFLAVIVQQTIRSSRCGLWSRLFLQLLSSSAELINSTELWDLH